MRTIIFLLIGLAAVATPILMSEDDSVLKFFRNSNKRGAAQTAGWFPFGAVNQSDPSYPNQPGPTADSLDANQRPIIWTGPTEPPKRFFQPINDLSSVLRFDVYPNWVKANWERVAVVPGDFGMEGLRVPLVTGNGSADLSGSMTYYFDERHQVQRICFQGWTGDASPLVSYLVSNHGFAALKTEQAGLYAKKSWGKPHSVLRLGHPPIVDRSRPQQQVFVFLELNHPQGNLPLGMEAKRALANTGL